MALVVAGSFQITAGSRLSQAQVPSSALAPSAAAQPPGLSEAWGDPQVLGSLECGSQSCPKIHVRVCVYIYTYMSVGI